MKKFLNLILLLLIILSNFSAFAQTRIEGLYATSSALPLDNYSINNMFDKDEDTYWMSPKGAGPDEGFMIYFAEPTYVSKIELDPLLNDKVGLIQRFEVYADGRMFWGLDNINTEISALYIKIARVDNTNYYDLKEGNITYRQYKFHPEMSVAISEIRFYDQDENELNIELPKTINGKITASSNLTPEVAYGPANVMNFKKDVSWAEGANNNGIGENLVFSTDEIITIDKIKIWNGYQRSWNHYLSNGRVKLFSFSSNEGSNESFELIDKQNPQIVYFKQPIKGSKFTLTVKDIFPGSKYEDLVISEVRFYNGDQPITLKTKNELDRITKNKSLTNSILKKYIDANISCTTSEFTKKENEETSEYYNYNSNQSLILRSNNTFVYYQSENEYIEAKDEDEWYAEQNQNQTIADGNWEIKEVTEKYVRVRIFGKIYTPTTSAELYKGEVTSDNVRIFQDYLTLTFGKISGERFIEDLRVLN